MKKKILLIDDDPSVRRFLFRILAEENYHVLPAANGTDAVKLANQTRIDLALLDLNLSGHSGWDTFEQLSTENATLPVIIITGRSNQLFPALASGAGALMEKPLDVPRLLRTVRDLLSEPPAVRRARMNGKAADFRYLPSSSEHQAPAARNHSRKNAKNAACADRRNSVNGSLTRSHY